MEESMQSTDKTKLTTLAELSGIFGIDKGNTKRFLKKKEIPIVKMRDLETKQLVLAVTKENAEKAILLREKDGYRLFTGESDPDETGVLDEINGNIDMVKYRSTLFIGDDEDVSICQELSNIASEHYDGCYMDAVYWLKEAEIHIHGQRVLITEALELIDKMKSVIDDFISKKS